MDIRLTLSLVILVLPLFGFAVQLILGKMKTPSDYVVDPHENPAHDHGDHANTADAHTADHTQPAADAPHDAVGTVMHDTHTAQSDHHYDFVVTKQRGEWTPADQKRAYSLSWISTAIMGICLALAIFVAYKTISDPGDATKPNYYPKVQASTTWVDFKDLSTSSIKQSYTVTLGILADNMASIMLIVVTLISFLVHLFSSEYMREPSMHGGRFNRFYAFLGLFTFSMLGIVIANNLLMIYIFWELVGLSSYLLIGFWYERPAPQYANKKAFIVNRVGDIGMFTGIMILYTQLGTLELTKVFDMLAAGHIPFGSNPWLTAAGILLFCGAIGKSAQFLLNVWLPDAMEGPTPVSALIHAATMVAAGVYLTARIFPLLTGDAMLFVAAIGAATALIAASIALVQTDLKKVLAFSTVSQLGYMVLALGVGAFSAGIFHLVTHAFFKACLFLGSGSVIHQMHHSLHHLHDHDRDPQDMRNMGGLRKKMPVTYLTMLVATLAISGIPLFSGYMSKDEILAGAWAFRNISPTFIANAVWIIGYAVAGMTAFYMFRMIFLTFWGEPKASDIYENIHENPRVMVAPLIVLAILSLWIPFGANPLNPGGGWFLSTWVKTPVNVTPAAVQPFAGMTHESPHEATPEAKPEGGKAEAMAPFQETIEHEVHHLHSTGIPGVASIPALLSLLVAGSGILVAFLLFGRAGAKGQQVSWAAPRGIRAFLFNRWYQDNFYEKIFPVGLTLLLMKMLAWFDQNVVDGIVNGVGSSTVLLARVTAGFDTYVVDGLVNLLGGTAQFLGLVMRQIQTGRIQTYVVYVILGVVVLFFAFR
ncbi:MAG: NADH-quinone oxidoreductase subunit L [Bacteroidota bacterium]